MKLAIKIREAGIDIDKVDTEILQIESTAHTANKHQIKHSCNDHNHGDVKCEPSIEPHQQKSVMNVKIVGVPNTLEDELTIQGLLEGILRINISPIKPSIKISNRYYRNEETDCGMPPTSQQSIKHPALPLF